MLRCSLIAKLNRIQLVRKSAILHKRLDTCLPEHQAMQHNHGVRMTSTANVRKIRIMTSGGFTAACAALLPQLDLPDKTEAIITATTIGVGPNSIPNRLMAGESADIVIASNASVVDMVRKGLILADSQTPLAHSVIGVAVRAITDSGLMALSS